jgi:hypothetical protein
MATSAGLVTANVAAAAIAVGAAQAMAPVGPANTAADAELIELCERWKRLHRVYIHTDRRAADAETFAAKAMPAKPVTLSEPFEVWPGEVQHPFGHRFTDRGWTRSELEEYADAKIWRSAHTVPGHSVDDETLLHVPEAARAHARRLLQQLDSWEAERERLRAPYERLSAVCSSLYDKLTELADRISECPARSLAGLTARPALSRLCSTLSRVPWRTAIASSPLYQGLSMTCSASPHQATHYRTSGSPAWRSDRGSSKRRPVTLYTKCGEEV